MEPLVVEFDLRVAPEVAFAVWAERCGTWWPPDHTISGDPAAIVVQPVAGGRIFERGRDGTEHDWGRVLRWEPPVRVVYLWHMFFPPEEATEVEVTFHPRGDGTRVVITQRGWERLGDAGPPRRERTGHVWRALSTHFVAVAEGGGR
ncbi:MAG: SRPBCC domain-containing protein [Thermoleophilia bacterium]